MDRVFVVYVYPPEMAFVEKAFSTLELLNAWLDKNYPNMDASEDSDGFYEIQELEVIKELD